MSSELLSMFQFIAREETYHLWSSKEQTDKTVVQNPSSHVLPPHVLHAGSWGAGPERQVTT